MPGPSIPPPRYVVAIDETYLAEWIQFGMTELYAYLDKHARFADYCDQRDKRPEEHQR